MAGPGRDLSAQQNQNYNENWTGRDLSLHENAANHNLPILIIGCGSNILFTENFDGLVIHLNLK